MICLFLPCDIVAEPESIVSPLSTGNIIFIVLVGVALVGTTIYLQSLVKKRRK